jgi:hypothetical protein
MHFSFELSAVVFFGRSAHGPWIVEKLVPPGRTVGGRDEDVTLTTTLRGSRGRSHQRAATAL